MTSTGLLEARSVADVQEAVRTHARLRPIAGRTKPALTGVSAEGALLDVSALAGMIDYRPAECTFTARAATRVAEVEAMLAADGLCLPFEPPFAREGATLGGTVAAGLSGPGRFRYGGVRDFLLGTRFVDGEGRLVRGGGQVVKNAAGFYLQHLLLGSLGRFGVMVELTFKVFPLAAARVTIAAECGTLARALDALVRLRNSTFEIEALDLVPPGTLWIRIGGDASAIDARAAALRDFIAPHAADDVRMVDPLEAQAAWDAARACGLNALQDDGVLSRRDSVPVQAGTTAAPVNRAGALVKVAITPSRIARLDARLDEIGGRAARRYSAGGEVAWLAWPGAIDALDRLLRELSLSGLVITLGPAAASAVPATAVEAGARALEPIIGVQPDPAFLARVRATLDPRGVFA